MDTLRTDCLIRNHADRTRKARLSKLLVDTGSDYTWIHENVLQRVGVTQEKKDLSFVMANGQVITRSVGFAVIHVEKHFTIDEVVFAQPGDLVLLGARTLEGLNLRVDAKNKKLVAGGPLTAA